MIFNGKRSGIFHNFTMDVDPGYKLIEKFRRGVRWYMVENKDIIRSICSKIKNQYHKIKLKNEFYKSIIKEDFLKIYHQQGAQLNQSNQNIEFIFGENINYHQKVNAYLEFDNTVRKNDTANFHNDGPVRLLKNAFAFCFKETRLSTTIGSDIEHNKFCCQVSAIMKVISNKDGDLLSQFDKINENEIPIVERIADLPPKLEILHIMKC